MVRKADIAPPTDREREAELRSLARRLTMSRMSKPMRPTQPKASDFDTNLDFRNRLADEGLFPTPTSGKDTLPRRFNQPGYVPVWTPNPNKKGGYSVHGFPQVVSADETVMGMAPPGDQALLQGGGGSDTLAGGGGETLTMGPNEEAVSSSSKGPRGIRNNNPGNIEYGKFARSMGATGSDGRFAKFDTPEQGIRAIVVLQQRYEKSGRETLFERISRWAPASDNNDVTAYANALARKMGIDINTPFSINDPVLGPAFLDGMIQHENGRQPYTAAQIQTAHGTAASPTPYDPLSGQLIPQQVVPPQDAQSAIADLFPPQGGTLTPDVPAGAEAYGPPTFDTPAQAAIADQFGQPGDLTADQIDELTRTDAAGNYTNPLTAPPPAPFVPASGPIGPNLGSMLSPADVLNAGPRPRPAALSPVRPPMPNTTDRNLGVLPPTPRLRPGGAPDAGMVSLPPSNPRRDPYGFPIDVNRPAIQNPDGSISTERSITFDAAEVGLPPEIVTVPTIVNGRQVSEQEARRLFAAGQNPPLQRGFNSFEEADRAAEARTRSIAAARATADYPAASMANMPGMVGMPPSAPPGGVGAFSPPGTPSDLIPFLPPPAATAGAPAATPGALARESDTLARELGHNRRMMEIYTAPPPPRPSFDQLQSESDSRLLASDIARTRGMMERSMRPLPSFDSAPPLAEARTKDDRVALSGPVAGFDRGARAGQILGLPPSLNVGAFPEPSFSGGGGDDALAAGNASPLLPPPVTTRPMPSYPPRAGDTVLDKTGEPIFDIGSVSSNGRTMLMRVSPTNISPLSDDDLAFGLSKGWQIEHQAPFPQGREGDAYANPLAYGGIRPPSPVVAPPPPPDLATQLGIKNIATAAPEIPYDPLSSAYPSVPPIPAIPAAAGRTIWPGGVPPEAPIDIKSPAQVAAEQALNPESLPPYVPDIVQPPQQSIVKAAAAAAPAKTTSRPPFLERAFQSAFGINPNGFFAGGGFLGGPPASFTPYADPRMATGFGGFMRTSGASPSGTNWQRGTSTAFGGAGGVGGPTQALSWQTSNGQTITAHTDPFTGQTFHSFS